MVNIYKIIRETTLFHHKFNSNFSKHVFSILRRHFYECKNFIFLKRITVAYFKNTKKFLKQKPQFCISVLYQNFSHTHTRIKFRIVSIRGETILCKSRLCNIWCRCTNCVCEGEFFKISFYLKCKWKTVKYTITINYIEKLKFMFLLSNLVCNVQRTFLQFKDLLYLNSGWSFTCEDQFQCGIPIERERE